MREGFPTFRERLTVMQQRWRWVTVPATLIASLMLLAPVARADDFDALPLPPDDAFPALPDEDSPPATAPVDQPAPAVEVAAPEQAVPEQAVSGQPESAAPAAEQPAAEPVVEQSAPTSAPVAGTADEAFDLKTKALEEKVNDLKEKIFRTKYRLATLADTVLGGVINSGAKLALWHRNELGSSYVLVSAAYTLDGAPLYTKVDESGDLNDREEFIVFDQRIVPGQHQISVQYELRGHGYGIFSYLEGMRVKLRTSHTFNVEPGKITKLTSLVHEKDGLTLEFADKPSVKFEMNVTKDIAPPSDDVPAADSVAPQASTEGSSP